MKNRMTVLALMVVSLLLGGCMQSFGQVITGDSPSRNKALGNMGVAEAQAGPDKLVEIWNMGCTAPMPIAENKPEVLASKDSKNANHPPKPRPDCGLIVYSPIPKQRRHIERSKGLIDFGGKLADVALGVAGERKWIKAFELFESVAGDKVVNVDGSDNEVQIGKKTEISNQDTRSTAGGNLGDTYGENALNSGRIGNEEGAGHTFGDGARVSSPDDYTHVPTVVRPEVVVTPPTEVVVIDPPVFQPPVIVTDPNLVVQ